MPLRGRKIIIPKPVQSERTKSSIFYLLSSILDHHSYLSATSGSTFVARRAGM